MEEDFLNSFAETFEIGSLLTELSEVSEITPDLSSDSGSEFSHSEGHGPIELSENSVSELFTNIVNWRNVPDNVASVDASLQAVNLNDIPEMSLSKLFDSVNWENKQVEEEVPAEFEEQYSVSNMFEDFNW